MNSYECFTSRTCPRRESVLFLLCHTQHLRSWDGGCHGAPLMPNAGFGKVGRCRDRRFPGAYSFGCRRALQLISMICNDFRVHVQRRYKSRCLRATESPVHSNRSSPAACVTHWVQAHDSHARLRGLMKACLLQTETVRTNKDQLKPQSRLARPLFEQVP